MSPPVDRPTPDLLVVLERIHQEAIDTRRKLESGEAINGRSGIRRIEEIAGDAVEDFAHTPDAVRYP